MSNEMGKSNFFVGFGCGVVFSFISTIMAVFDYPKSLITLIIIAMSIVVAVVKILSEKE